MLLDPKIYLVLFRVVCDDPPVKSAKTYFQMILGMLSETSKVTMLEKRLANTSVLLRRYADGLMWNQNLFEISITDIRSSPILIILTNSGPSTGICLEEQLRSGKYSGVWQ